MDKRNEHPQKSQSQAPAAEGDQRPVRREYAHGALRREQLAANPLRQLQLWLQEALQADLRDATAMTLATADAAGVPSARIVLLKHYDEDGFVWYTDYRSQKGLELAVNPQATVLFYWREFERQIRVSGTVEKVADAMADDYFQSRPRDSQLSAVASVQSQVIADRAALESRVAALSRNAVLARPADWGGYRLRPREYEFWQGRISRLHDRFRYRRRDGAWQVERLQP